jgi:hypothetical protein
MRTACRPRPCASSRRGKAPPPRAARRSARRHGGSEWTMVGHGWTMVMVGHGGSWVDHVCLRGVGCHKAPRDVAALGRRQGDDAAVGHDQHADGDPQRRSVHRPARRCKPAGRAWRRYLLANDARPMPKTSWLRPRPAGAPEAAFSARSCLRLPQLRSALATQPFRPALAGHVGLVSTWRQT